MGTAFHVVGCRLILERHCVRRVDSTFPAGYDVCLLGGNGADETLSSDLVRNGGVQVLMSLPEVDALGKWTIPEEEVSVALLSAGRHNCLPSMV